MRCTSWTCTRDAPGAAWHTETYKNVYERAKWRTRWNTNVNLNANAEGGWGGGVLKSEQHMEHPTIKWFPCPPEALATLVVVVADRCRLSLYLHVWAFLWAHKSAHTCLSHLPVRMDGDVMAHLTIRPSSPSSLSCHPSIHSSFIATFIPPSAEAACKREMLKAKWSEVDGHYCLCYGKTSNGKQYLLRINGVSLKGKREGSYLQRDCGVFSIIRQRSTCSWSKDGYLWLYLTAKSTFPAILSYWLVGNLSHSHKNGFMVSGT